MNAGPRLRELLERLVELGGRVEVAEGRLAASAIRTFLAAGDRTLVSTDLGAVDVMQGLPLIPSFARLDRDAVDVDMDGTIVRICSLESLLAMKRASQRGRDIDDLEALEAAHLPDEDSTPGQ